MSMSPSTMYYIAVYDAERPWSAYLATSQPTVREQLVCCTSFLATSMESFPTRTLIEASIVTVTRPSCRHPPPIQPIFTARRRSPFSRCRTLPI
ncbi:hypothetical protein BD626DRAFT_93259 [Schizophyllum amplum]|uniref:Uncharacterized protein n=1 Tax=Schizophyllum amplum TaxID=97359 RepID=A0A550BRY8_9AGAR|nr:hypothetical protein BD626DRAFT_93259 [Auriculariopsis ampla]